MGPDFLPVDTNHNYQITRSLQVKQHKQNHFWKVTCTKEIKSLQAPVALRVMLKKAYIFKHPFPIHFGTLEIQTVSTLEDFIETGELMNIKFKM